MDARAKSPLDAQAAAEEAALVARLRARDEVAFEELVRLHGQRMLAVARRFFSNDADAQDALQDAFLSVHRAVPDFAGDCRLGTWLHRIVVNSSLMRLRTRRRRPEVSMDRLDAEAGVEGSLAAARPEPRTSVHSMAQAETRVRVRACIDRIPEAYRTVLLLRDIEGMPILEVCRVLAASAGTVKMKLHRARHMLRGLLDPYMEGDAS